MKKVLQALFIVLVAMVIIEVSSIQVAYAETLYAHENFESYDVDAYPDTFTMIRDGGDATLQRVEQSGGNKYFRISSISGGSAHDSNKVAGSDFKTQMLDFGCVITPVSGTTPFSFDLFTEGGLVSITMSNNEIRFFDTSGATHQVIGSYSLGDSYIFRIVMDTVNDTVDIYIDGVLVVDDDPLREEQGRGTYLEIHNGSLGDVAVGYIDSINIQLVGEYQSVGNPQTGEKSWFEKLFDLFR